MISHFSETICLRTLVTLMEVLLLSQRNYRSTPLIMRHLINTYHRVLSDFFDLCIKANINGYFGFMGANLLELNLWI